MPEDPAGASKDASNPRDAEPLTAAEGRPSAGQAPPTDEPTWRRPFEAVGAWLKTAIARLSAPAPAPQRSRSGLAGRMTGRGILAGSEDAPVGDRPRTAVRRIFQGEAGVLEAMATTLGGGDPREAGPWQERLERLVDAVLEEALEAGYVDPPRADPFWAAFTVDQGRDVMKALGSLGFHVDGRGAWLDDRAPARRDLSIAVGYAGVDPVRLRTWPAPEELEALGGQVVIAGADFLDVAAPGLSMAEVSAVAERSELGRGLDELWADWDRVRPLLLAEA